MEEPIAFWGYKEQESNLILPKYDDDDDEEYKLFLARLHSREKRLLTSSRPYVCPPVRCVNTSLTGRISIKSGNGDFHENVFKKSRFG
jgi:hypothetical protein